MVLAESENLPNCLHAGYLLNLAVARKLLRASQQMPLFKFEDVYLTGMVAELAGVAPTDHMGFNQKVCSRDGQNVLQHYKPMQKKVPLFKFPASAAACQTDQTMPKQVMNILHST